MRRAKPALPASPKTVLRHAALLLAIAAMAFAALALLPAPASAAPLPTCDTFIVSDTPTQWNLPGSGAWSSPSVVRTRNPAWTVFPNGGPGTPTPQTIWNSDKFVNETINFRNNFTACSGKYVLDITADNNFVAQVNGVTVQQCLDQAGRCFSGYFHSNFTPSCSSCTLQVRADNFGGDAMVQYRLQWCNGALATTASPSGTAGSNGWYRSAVTVTLTPTAACGSPETYYRLDSTGGFTKLSATPGSVSVTGDGTHTLDYYSVDGLGQENTKSLTLKIDTVAPACAGSYSGTLGSNGWYKVAGSETLTGTDATSGIASTSYTLNSGASTTYTAPFAVSGQSTNTVVCSVTDNAGNTNSATFTVKLDTVAPTCTGSYSGTAGTGGWYQTAGSETLTGSDATSGIASTTYTLNGGASTTYTSAFSISTQGTNTVVCTVTDLAGNTASPSLTVKLDTVAPTCAGSYSGTLGNNGWYKVAGSETLTGSDATSGIASTTYTLNSGASTAYTSAFGIATQGTNTVACTVKDNAGNTNTATFTVKLDSVAPTCAGSFDGTPGSAGWYVTAGRETLTSADATSGVASTAYTLNGGASTTYSGPFAVSDEGSNTVVCSVTDNAGNRASPSSTVRIDTVPPDVAITDPKEATTYLEDNVIATPAPPPHATIMGTKTVRASASDATSGMDRVEFYVDGALRATVAATPYEWSWSAGEEVEGDHDLAVVAYDIAGNDGRTNMTVTTAPSPFDIICHDVPAVIETIRTPGGEILGLLGNVIHLPDVVKHVVKSAAIYCDPPLHGYGGRGTPCGEVRFDEAGTMVAATLTYRVDPNGAIQVYWCVWADSTTLAPAQAVLDPAKHVYVGTTGRADDVFQVVTAPQPDVYVYQCQVPFYVHAVAGDVRLAKSMRIAC